MSREFAPFLPSYGKIHWGRLAAAINDACGSDVTDFNMEDYIGHQLCPAFNMNSLNRIVTGFRDEATKAERERVAAFESVLRDYFALHYIDRRKSGETFWAGSTLVPALCLATPHQNPPAIGAPREGFR